MLTYGIYVYINETICYNTRASLQKNIITDIFCCFAFAQRQKTAAAAAAVRYKLQRGDHRSFVRGFVCACAEVDMLCKVFKIKHYRGTLWN